MNKSLSIIAIAALASLGACATPFKADVSRFQALPAPNGETFVVQASDPKLAGGLEFQTYARLVSAELVEQGYRPAAAAAQAALVVKMDYDVDNGRERVYSTPSSYGIGYGGFGGGFGGGYGGGYYGGGRRGFIYGFNDPFLFGGFDRDVSSYTVYTGELDLQIERTATGERVFEGTAKAMSRDNRLTRLVPNLVEAMFTGFPGNSGEEVRITLAPEPRR